MLRRRSRLWLSLAPPRPRSQPPSARPAPARRAGAPRGGAAAFGSDGSAPPDEVSPPPPPPQATASASSATARPVRAAIDARFFLVSLPSLGGLRGMRA